ncbi:MAG: PIN domain-containing protein [Chloroflexi bacterium]|nr:PIN domain-containing protein [Chloroflexota bacterium]
MGWVDDLAGQLVGLDTAPLIYYIEEDPTYLPLVDPFFQALADGELRVVTSTITLVEVLTQPLRQGSAELAAQYRDLLLATEGLTVQPVSPAIAEEAARLRAVRELRTPDAIQLATARLAGAHIFVTNGTRLAAVPDLPVLVLDALHRPE